MSEKSKEATAVTMELEASESEIERLWLDEVENRLKDIYEGKVKAVPADEVFHRALSELL